jgi:hypothetical protein
VLRSVGEAQGAANAMATPLNVVRTPEEEIAWERAKQITRKQYPRVTGDRFYRIVMGIYKKIAHYEPDEPTRRRHRAQ